MTNEQLFKETAKVDVALSAKRFVEIEIARLDLARLRVKKEIRIIESKISNIQMGVLPKEKIEGQFSQEQCDIVLKLTGRDIQKRIDEYNSKFIPIRDLKIELAKLVKEQSIRKRKIGFLRTLQFKFVPIVKDSPNEKLRVAAKEYKKKLNNKKNK